VQSVFATPRGSPVQAFSLSFVAAALGLGNLMLDAAVKMARLKFLAIARGHGVFEPEIQSDVRFRGNRVLNFTGHG
jgi:hypothetical protein